MGKCLNNGACFNGKCICVEGFDGQFCEINRNIILILIII
jgi:hypothetical protein